MRTLILCVLCLALAGCSNPGPTDPARTSAVANPQADTPIAATAQPATPERLTQAATATTVPTSAAGPELAATAQPTEERYDPVEILPISDPPATLTPLPFERTLQAQSQPLSGEDVTAAQLRLLALGYTQLGDADGLYGARTSEAVRAFQERNDLEVDGILGPQSWERLFGPAPVAAATAGPLIPLVDLEGGWLLGGTRDGRWIAAFDTAALAQASQAYTAYLPNGTVSAVTGSAPGAFGVPCDNTVSVAFSPNLNTGIAVGAGLNARPRPISPGDRDEPLILDKLGTLLEANGITQTEIQLSQVLVADLDGDGRDEWVVSATRMQVNDAGFPTPDAAAGDYSVILLLRDLESTPQVLIEQYHPQASVFTAPEVFTIMDLLDLNGDGTLEIIMLARYYEGAFSAILANQNGEYREVLAAGCGV